jgi:hypothetical protein
LLGGSWEMMVGEEYGEEYKTSLFDGRATYFEGDRVEDLPGHPILGVAVRQAAAGQRALSVAGLANGNGH